VAKTTAGKITDLIQDDKNANSHKERGGELLAKSMHELGAGRSVLVDAQNVLIAGNETTKTAIAEGITKTIVVETDGDTLVVVKRTDLDLNDPGESGRKARQMAIVDNAAALEGIAWDIEAVQEIEEQWGFDANEWGADMPDLGNTSMLDEVNRGDENSEWVGMPEFNTGEKSIKIVINFEYETDREEFANKHELEFNMKNSTTWSTTHPFKENIGSTGRKYETDDE